jgi:hypothetical protein
MKGFAINLLWIVPFAYAQQASPPKATCKFDRTRVVPQKVKAVDSKVLELGAVVPDVVSFPVGEDVFVTTQQQGWSCVTGGVRTSTGWTTKTGWMRSSLLEKASRAQ